MVVRYGSVVLACLLGIPAGQAVAQSGYLYPRAAAPYAEDPPPGYYRSPRGYYRRLPPNFHEEDGVVFDRRGRRVIFYDDYPPRPYVRRYVRVAPGPYSDDGEPSPRPHFRAPAESDFSPGDDRAAREDRRRRDRQAALPPDAEPESGPLPQTEPRAPATYSSLPPADRAVSSTSADLPPRLRRQTVDYPTKEPAGTIVVDTRNTYLYHVLGDGRAMRYGIGVGREGFTWAGRERISRMAEWPDWYPPKDMIKRQPDLPRMMAGGPGNPLGARALYLGNTLFRIHGTSDASSIGNYVSSGCIRLLNEDIEDLYSRVQVGARVVVLRGGKPPAIARR
ncbi:MAG: L,D-transpeptidase family protein [Rhizobiales bacterium]|nr:L,D-transpeptidase family protein [Hyphomicrobiales bacterium]